MTSYSLNDKANEQMETVLSEIKELVIKKLALLLNFIFNFDQKNWFISLKIKDNDIESLKHYNNISNQVNMLLNYKSLEDIEEHLIENFAQCLLGTPELLTQINKLVLKYFG